MNGTDSETEKVRSKFRGRKPRALGMKYRGDERTSELLLTQDMIRQLAFEAQFRNMSIGGLVGELLIAMLKRDHLFQHVLEPNSKQP